MAHTRLVALLVAAVLLAPAAAKWDLKYGSDDGLPDTLNGKKLSWCQKRLSHFWTHCQPAYAAFLKTTTTQTQDLHDSLHSLYDAAHTISMASNPPTEQCCHATKRVQNQKYVDKCGCDSDVSQYLANYDTETLNSIASHLTQACGLEPFAGWKACPSGPKPGQDRRAALLDALDRTHDRVFDRVRDTARRDRAWSRDAGRASADGARWQDVEQPSRADGYGERFGRGNDAGRWHERADRGANNEVYDAGRADERAYSYDSAPARDYRDFRGGRRLAQWGSKTYRDGLDTYRCVTGSSAGDPCTQYGGCPLCSPPAGYGSCTAKGTCNLGGCACSNPDYSYNECPVSWANIVYFVSYEIKCDKECFPGAATARLEGGAAVRMDALRVGDRVQVIRPDGAVAFDDVYFFGHQINNATTTYVQLTLEPLGAAAGNRTAGASVLELTADHFLPILPAGAAPQWRSHVMVRAGAVKPGAVAFVVGPDGRAPQAATVVGVRRIVRRGLFNPYTLSGSIVVDGVLASSHSRWVLDDALDALGATRHVPAVYQALFAPLRALYHVLGARRMAVVGSVIADIGNGELRLSDYTPAAQQHIDAIRQAVFAPVGALGTTAAVGTATAATAAAAAVIAKRLRVMGRATA